MIKKIKMLKTFLRLKYYRNKTNQQDKFISKSQVFSIDYPSNFNDLTETKTLEEP